MKDSYPIIVFILGILMIIISLLYKYLFADGKKFLEVFYVGHILVLAGIITSDLVGFGVIIACVIIFISVSIYMIMASRKLRR